MAHRGGFPVFFLTALFRAAGLAVVGLAALPLFGETPADAILIAAVGALGAVSLLARGLLRRGRIAAGGPVAAAVFVVLAALLVLAAQRTGGLQSPLIVLLGALVAAAACELPPVANFFSLSGVCLLLTLMVMGTAEGLLPSGPFAAEAAPHEAPFALLVIELGLLGLLGFGANALAARIREQEDELLGRGLRDPETGTLLRSFFHARLVGLIEGLRGGKAGISLVLFDLGGIEEGRLADAGALLQASVRGEDLAGRVGPALFAAALVGASADTGPRAARRLLAGLEKLGGQGRAGTAHLEAAEIGDDAAGAARRLLAAARESLAAERVGFAA